MRGFSSLLLTGLLSLWSLQAEEKTAVNTVIIPPPMEGTVSLGVFAQDGECVRVLAKNAAQDTLPAALNGWAISWDGKLADGSPAPAGTYEIRGLVIGEVEVEGVAWHFNDWIEPDHADATPARTVSALLLVGGGFIVLQTNDHDQRQLKRYTPSGDLTWAVPVSAHAQSLAVQDQTVFVADDAAVSTFQLTDGQSAESTSLPGGVILATGNAGLFYAVGDQLFVRGPQEKEGKLRETLPISIKLLAGAGDHVFASDGEKIFLIDSSSIHEVPVHPNGKILALACGNPETFWMIVATSTGAELGNFRADGFSIRELTPEDSLRPDLISVSVDDRTVLEISRDEKREQTRLLEKADQTSGEEISYWKPVLQKEIIQASRYGFSEDSGKIVPTGEIETHQSVPITLVENPLNPGKAEKLVIRPGVVSGGVWVSSSDGLPLFPVAADLTSERLALVTGASGNEARLFFYQNAAVAEYQITGLPNMMSFTSGPVEWPPGPALKPDERDVPDNNPAPTP